MPQLNITTIKKQLSKFAPKHDIRKAAVFGSFARGEHTKNSDIDILIDLPKGKTLLDLVAIRQELNQILNRKVDVLTYKSIHPLLKKRVLDEQKIIYERS